MNLLTELFRRIFRPSNLRASDTNSSEATTFPDVDGDFSLTWSIVRDCDSVERLSFEFSVVGGELLHSEEAVFENPTRAKVLVDLLCTKYGDALREIRLAPGVSVYIGGRNISKFENFAEYVRSYGYNQEVPASRRDFATKEVLEAETIFRKRPNPDL